MIYHFFWRYRFYKIWKIFKVNQSKQSQLHFCYNMCKININLTMKWIVEKEMIVTIKGSFLRDL